MAAAARSSWSTEAEQAPARWGGGACGRCGLAPVPALLLDPCQLLQHSLHGGCSALHLTPHARSADPPCPAYAPDTPHSPPTQHTHTHSQVIELNVSTAAVDPQKTRDITEGDAYDIEYSYSVKWKPVTIKFSDRMDRYSRYSFLPQHLEVRSAARHSTPCHSREAFMHLAFMHQQPPACR